MASRFIHLQVRTIGRGMRYVFFATENFDLSEDLQDGGQETTCVCTDGVYENCNTSLSFLKLFRADVETYRWTK